MARVYINQEGFEYIEAAGKVTPSDFAEKFGITVPSARSWLSKWTSKGYLKYNINDKPNYNRRPGRPGGGTYSIGIKQWGEMYFDNAFYT